MRIQGILCRLIIICFLISLTISKIDSLGHLGKYLGPRNLRSLDDADEEEEDICNDPEPRYVSGEDDGCEINNQKPCRCPNTLQQTGPICVANYGECNASPGCSLPPFKTRCVTGECVSHISYCPYDDKNQQPFTETCESSSFERCYDGICRRKGSCDCIEYSGCKAGEFECPDGSCERSSNKCIISSDCPVNIPFDCGYGNCMLNADWCPQKLSFGAFGRKELTYDYSQLKKSERKYKKPRVIPLESLDNGSITIRATVDMRIFQPWPLSPFYDVVKKNKKGEFQNWCNKWDKDYIIGSVSAERFKSVSDRVFPARYELQCLDKDAKLIFKYIGTKSLENVTNTIERNIISTLETQFKTEFEGPEGKPAANDSERLLPPRYTLFSAPIQVTTKGRKDDTERFRAPVYLEFRINNQDLSKATQFVDIELSELARRTLCLGRIAIHTNEWTCVSRNFENYEHFPNMEKGEKHMDKIAYLIPHPGIFAVILKPDIGQLTLNEGQVGGSGGSYWKLIINFILILTGLTAVVIKAKNLILGQSRSEQEKNIEKYKYQLVRNTNTDFKGQKALVKLKEPFNFTENPLRINKSHIEKCFDVNRAIAVAKEEGHRKEKEQRRLEIEEKRLDRAQLRAEKGPGFMDALEGGEGDQNDVDNSCDPQQSLKNALAKGNRSDQKHLEIFEKEHGVDWSKVQSGLGKGLKGDKQGGGILGGLLGNKAPIEESKEKEQEKEMEQEKEKEAQKKNDCQFRKIN